MKKIIAFIPLIFAVLSVHAIDLPQPSLPPPPPGLPAPPAIFPSGDKATPTESNKVKKTKHKKHRKHGLHKGHHKSGHKK